ncbi:PA14 domain-containing protein [Hymenobacter sp. ASUV-10]|uniref:PA14 domain-containing protein n=1 Tax=Hymenobacter aranciens TaxID=3063996 RepID=A0ABT9B974_9BACT|nr:PA14 domain-containing protein [Hymenobacter sp. ASUV-10]MDO7874819.1 PA14 domain-containing protein [Hymenobacter sp. ASUV-10]
MHYLSHSFLFGCLILAAGTARAQAPVGDGLLAQYYDGENFERVMYVRHDPSINFDWGHGEPAPGLPVEYFSVRWSGWLVPPTTGRYIFHVTVDDGMRVWLNDKRVFSSWIPQQISNYTFSVDLKAGEPYRLRVDYFQNILDTRAQLTWEIPNQPKPEATWRNGWGTLESAPAAVPISSRYLFSKDPAKLLAKPAPAPKPAPAVAKPAVIKPTPPPAPAPRPATSPRIASPPAPRPATPAPTPVPAPAAAAPTAATDSAGARVARLVDGESVTLPDLYFEQGKAQLLPAARTALDALAQALSPRPSLRLEVQGHTDNVGNAELNRQLSQQRAEAVCLYLTAHGVASEQLRPVGYGGTRPVADNADLTQRPKNRRVVLVRL